jgi:hypothetical protein
MCFWYCTAEPTGPEVISLATTRQSFGWEASTSSRPGWSRPVDER